MHEALRLVESDLAIVLHVLRNHIDIAMARNSKALRPLSAAYRSAPCGEGSRRHTSLHNR
jgi:hypothetical protein